MSIEQRAQSYEFRYSREEKKLLGVHYTPDKIVEYIVRKTLQPYLESDSHEDIHHITIVDPACGSGLFLLKAFDLLCGVWKQHFGRLHSEDAQYILENNLYGVDIDPSAVEATKQNLFLKGRQFGVESVNLEDSIQQGDTLAQPLSNVQMKLDYSYDSEYLSNFNFKQVFPHIFKQGGFDCVVGNPPYIRIQHIKPEQRKKYVKLYQTASGRFDIGGLFIELAGAIAKPEGRIGYIVSNKLLTTHGAAKLREYILSHYTILEIIDLADTKQFQAAILPMILIMKKSPSQARSFVYTSIYKIKTTRNTPLSVEYLLSPIDRYSSPVRIDIKWNGELFRVEKFISPLPFHKQRVWTFHHPIKSQLLKKLRDKSVCSLGSIAYKISVGLKTTADNVFIKPMKLDFIKQQGLESDLIFPILESHNIHRWHCDWQRERDLYVLYPHQEQDGKVVPVCLDDYPNAKKYLMAHQKQLESRRYLSQSNRRWYEIWVHQSPVDFRCLKLITPDIAPDNCFALDDTQLFVNGTCFYIILKDQSLEHNLIILALLNSKVLEYFHKNTSGNVLYAKRFRYWTSYLNPYPIPDITHSKNASLVKQLFENTKILVESPALKEARILESTNDQLIYQLFKLTDSEIEEVESSLIL